MSILISQLVVVIINVYIATTENKKNIYIVTFLFNLSNLIMYMLNKDVTTTAMYIVITLRSLVYIYKDKINIIIVPIIAILAQLIIGFTTIENMWQLIPILVPCYVCYYMWFNKTTQHLRINNAICNSLWFVYNIYSGLYIASISRVITVTANIVQYYKHKNTTVQ